VWQPLLITVIGAVSIVLGAALAAHSYFKGQERVQTVAGLLLIAGFGCFGVALSFILQIPLP
jgi:uncharacterized membrane protein